MNFSKSFEKYLWRIPFLVKLWASTLKMHKNLNFFTGIFRNCFWSRKKVILTDNFWYIFRITSIFNKVFYFVQVNILFACQLSKIYLRSEWKVGFYLARNIWFFFFQNWRSSGFCAFAGLRPITLLKMEFATGIFQSFC